MSSPPRPRVLLLAYHFPPMGGAGAQRAVKLARHLVDVGWDPVIVTRAGEWDERYNPVDERLGDEVPAGVAVHRVAGEPPTSVGWRSRAERLAGVLPARARWWSKAAAETAIRHAGGVDLVHAFLEPYETALAADRVAASLGVPWIADLQDPWALDELRIQISRLHVGLERARMRRGLASAAAIVMNTDAAADALVRTLPQLARTPVHAIPNGFDPDEWAAPAPQRSDGKFRIVHTGTLHTAVGIAHRRSKRLHTLLGGLVAPVDLLTRSHVFVIEAIDRLIGSRPELSGRIELHLAGMLSQADLDAAVGRPYVRPLGFRPHGEIIDLVRSADLLFLPMHDLPVGVPARLVPCKTYEYLAAERPILAAVPDGDARELLSRAPGVHLCRPSDVDAMTAALAVEIDCPSGFAAIARRDMLGRYERGAIGDELVRVYEAALAAGRPSRWGHDECSLVGSAVAT